MSSKPLRLAVIGLGMAAKPHLAALARLEGRVTVTGLYNRSADKAHAAAAGLGCPVFASADEIAADADTDAVLLLTPPDQRTGLVQQMADAGKHILMEKPLERTTEAARGIVDACEKAGIALGVVFQFRFRPASERLAQAVRDGELGDISLVRTEVPWWRPQGYYDEAGRGTYARDGGGVLITQAIHTLDLMLSLTGPVEQVQGLTGTTSLHAMEAEDFAAAGLTFANGALGSVMATTAAFPGETERLVIGGTKASAELHGGRLTISRHDGETETLGEVTGTGGGADPMAFPSDWHRDLIADFADAVQDGRPPRITGRAALAVHELIDAIAASSRTGNRIGLEGTAS